MKITIEVTQEDIDAGCPSNAALCPIARAAKRQGLEWYVEQRRVYDAKRQREYHLPVEAKEFILLYDNEIKPNPFSFEMEL